MSDSFCDQCGARRPPVDGEGFCMACAVVEIARLQAIVDKLPKTADGVPALWDMHVWGAHGIRWKVRRPGGYQDIYVDNECGSCFWRYAKEFYSTQAAAEAAREVMR